MTRTVRDRILKDANGDITDHLRNHIHLTNCIHLKNHMHKQSPISMTDRSLIRDLVVLQKSRSLRDPSMSPPSWQSPSAADMLPRRGGEGDAIVENGRRSVGIERQRDGSWLSGHSPTLAAGGSGSSGVQEHRRDKREEPSGRQLGAGLVSGRIESPLDANVVNDGSQVNLQMRGKKVKEKGIKIKKDDHLKILSEQMNEVSMASENAAASSHVHLRGRYSHHEKTAEEAETSNRSHVSGRTRVKMRKFRGGRRTRAAVASRDAGGQNEMLSEASNSLAHLGASHPNYGIEEGEEEFAQAQQNVTRAPGNGCGIPWNWSRIHDKGKTILDIAGRGLSCGLSDPRSKKAGQLPQGREFSMPVMSDHSGSSTEFEGEALPLLINGSQGSTENAAWVHDYSGELGIFADNLLKREMDSDLASEARSGPFGDQRHILRGHDNNSRHQNLTQKYLPRTFRDLVGQNLVVQALSNAVARRKVGLLYVFYGPHGTGKTSCARIFARALNCLSVEQPKPCGFCDSCVAHDVGKSRNIREVGPVSNLDFHNIMELLENMAVSQAPSQYRVFIFDDCDTLTPECWSAISKVIDRAPRRVVILLVSSSLDVLPHIIISRCQKFCFPKLKDAEIIYTLQWIATKEDFEIDKDALKLIVSRSDGSLRDAEMTLEQLSLLGQKISVPLVQELVGLISDEKLVDLLDLALSADTVNTVKNLREIMASGGEPLALMSQLATVITDILAGSYDFRKERPRRKFFRRPALMESIFRAVLKEDTEKLRQALKTLSEAEKQLRLSNDKLTWLTAALLQLAPDQQYMLPSSSADTSLNQSPLGLNTAGTGKERPRKSNVEHAEMLSTQRGLSTTVRLENHQAGSSGDVFPKTKGGGTSNIDRIRTSSKQFPSKLRLEMEELWMEVLKQIQLNSLKEFLFQEGKLSAVSFGEAPTVQLMFSSSLTKSQAEKFGDQILQAFEDVLGQPITIEIRCSKKDSCQEGPSHVPPSAGLLGSKRTPMAGDHDSSKRVLQDRYYPTEGLFRHFDSIGAGRSEIVELEASPRGPEHENTTVVKRREVEGAPALSNKSSRRFGEQNQSKSLVKSKVSLAHVIQQAEGCAQQNGWSKRKAVSIAEKLEQENLRLEPRSKNLLCWRSSRVPRRKLTHLKVRTRRPQAFLRFVSCGKCLSTKSPR